MCVVRTRPYHSGRRLIRSLSLNQRDERRPGKGAEMQQAARKFVAENESRFEELGEALLRGMPHLSAQNEARLQRLKEKRKERKRQERENRERRESEPKEHT